MMIASNQKWRKKLQIAWWGGCRGVVLLCVPNISSRKKDLIFRFRDLQLTSRKKKPCAEYPCLLHHRSHATQLHKRNRFSEFLGNPQFNKNKVNAPPLVLQWFLYIILLIVYAYYFEIKFRPIKAATEQAFLYIQAIKGRVKSPIFIFPA